MKILNTGARILAGLALSAGLMIGCTDFLGSEKSQGAVEIPAVESGALSLSIKDDKFCRAEWQAILTARSAGKADSAAEEALLAACVHEIRATKNVPKPVIPVPMSDSGIRCKWIVSQIEGGRDSLKVSYRKYCPDDCRILAVRDSAAALKLCRDTVVIGPKPRPVDTGSVTKPRDTLIIKPDPMADTCRVLRAKLGNLKEGDPARADVEKLLLAYCGKIPPVIVPADSCKLLYARLMKMDTSTAEFVQAEKAWSARCGGILPPKPDTIADTCAMVRRKWDATKPGDPARADLEKKLMAYCGKIPPVIVPADSCKLLYARLMKMDTSTAEFARAAKAWSARCGGIVPPKDTVIIVKPVPITRDSICKELKLRLSKATDEKRRAELQAAYKAKCLDTVVVMDPRVGSFPVPNSETVRKKLSKLVRASAIFARSAA